MNETKDVKTKEVKSKEIRYEEFLVDLLAYLDGYADIEDGKDGLPRANLAMRIQTMIQDCLHCGDY